MKMNFTATIGVEIFFVISGFLIGKIIYRIIQKDDFSFNDVREFWKRRWFRTLPNYYLVLLINILLWFLIYGKETRGMKDWTLDEARHDHV